MSVSIFSSMIHYFEKKKANKNQVYLISLKFVIETNKIIV